MLHSAFPFRRNVSIDVAARERVHLIHVKLYTRRATTRRAKHNSDNSNNNSSLCNYNKRDKVAQHVIT